MPPRKATKKKPAKKPVVEKTKEETTGNFSATDKILPTSIYDFKANSLQGEEIDLSKYKGHVCIIVNVASRCGHTKSNYEQLVELYDEYGDSKGLRVLAFPCNQFGGQESGDAEKIQKFVDSRNVKFDVFEKISVNGKNAHPLWVYLKEQLPGPKGKDIKWNFTKFIINDEGIPVERHQPSTKPITLLPNLEKLW